MTLTVGRACAYVAAACFVVAFVVTKSWVDAAGDARDAWALAGFFFGALALAVD